jgi:pentatricopeptide repeat protein
MGTLLAFLIALSLHGTAAWVPHRRGTRRLRASGFAVPKELHWHGSALAATAAESAGDSTSATDEDAERLVLIRAIQRGGSRPGEVAAAFAAANALVARGLLRTEAESAMTIRAFGRAGNLTAALSVLEHVKGDETPPTVAVYNAAIAACRDKAAIKTTSAENVQRAASMAVALLREIRASPTIAPDVYTYNAAISACSKARQWESALALLDEASQHSIGRWLVFVCSRGGPERPTPLPPPDMRPGRRATRDEQCGAMGCVGCEARGRTVCMEGGDISRENISGVAPRSPLSRLAVPRTLIQPTMIATRFDDE